MLNYYESGIPFEQKWMWLKYKPTLVLLLSGITTRSEEVSDFIAYAIVGVLLSEEKCMGVFKWIAQHDLLRFAAVG